MYLRFEFGLPSRPALSIRGEVYIAQLATWHVTEEPWRVVGVLVFSPIRLVPRGSSDSLFNHYVIEVHVIPQASADLRGVQNRRPDMGAACGWL